VGEVGVLKLKYPLGTTHGFEPVRPEVNEVGAGWQAVGHDFCGHARNEHLPAVRERPHAGGPDDRLAAVVALVAQVSLAGVHGHSYAERLVSRPPLCRERTLDSNGRGDGVGRFREHGHHAVPFALLLRPHTAVGGDDLGDELVVARGGDTHGLAVALPKACRPFDVGQDEGDGPLWEVDERSVLRPLHAELSRNHVRPSHSHGVEHAGGQCTEHQPGG